MLLETAFHMRDPALRRTARPECRRRAGGVLPLPAQVGRQSVRHGDRRIVPQPQAGGCSRRVIVKDGRFRTSGNNEPIRFLGIGIGGDGVFELDRDAAEKVAARLAKNGVNIVRFHNLDGSDRDRDTLIDFSRPGSCHFNPEHLDRLDYFIAQLKKQGIYLVMGLKVNRTLLPADGAPAGTRLGKRTDRFAKAWIDSQKQWARRLLTHVNPYTGTTLADDPAVVSVELNNESSLLFENLNWIAGLHPELLRELTGLWNDWLLEKYGSDRTLEAAWSKGAASAGNSLLRSASRWHFEHQENLKEICPNSAAGSGASVETVVLSRNDQDWKTQLQLPGLTLEDGCDYTLEFEASADRPGNVRVVSSLDKSDWRNCGLDEAFHIGPEPRKFRFCFTAGNTERGHVRISFGVGHAPAACASAALRSFPAQGSTVSTANRSPRNRFLCRFPATPPSSATGSNSWSISTAVTPTSCSISCGMSSSCSPWWSIRRSTGAVSPA